MPKKPKTQPAAKVAKRKAEAPEWLSETPATTYVLEAGSDQIIEPLQTIELSLDEYENLKRHLGKLRGHTVPVEVTNAR